MTNDQIKQLFVEYKFLGIEPQETETPFSLPKPKPYHQIQFNFNKSKYQIPRSTEVSMKLILLIDVKCQ